MSSSSSSSHKRKYESLEDLSNKKPHLSTPHETTIACLDTCLRIKWVHHHQSSETPRVYHLIQTARPVSGFPECVRMQIWYLACSTEQYTADHILYHALNHTFLFKEQIAYFMHWREWRHNYQCRMFRRTPQYTPYRDGWMILHPLQERINERLRVQPVVEQVWRDDVSMGPLDLCTLVLSYLGPASFMK